MPSLPLTLGVEIVVAKTVDYTSASVTRHTDSPARAFYGQMARAGLKAGWEKTGEMLPWWYGALSSGVTGATDFMAGSVLAGLLRQQLDAAIAREPALQGIQVPSLDEVLALLRGEALPHVDDERAALLKQVVDTMLHGDGDGALLRELLKAGGEGGSSVELKSAITRHLRDAVMGPQESELADFVKRNLVSSAHKYDDPLGGSVLGHGIAGAATGILTGHPELGVLVTLLDSLSEGLLAQKAMKGNYRALTKIKAQLLLKGIRDAERRPDWKGQVSNRLLGLYSQMGEEVRLFGEDLVQLTRAAEASALTTASSSAVLMAAAASATATTSATSATSATVVALRALQEQRAAEDTTGFGEAFAGAPPPNVANGAAHGFHGQASAADVVDLLDAVGASLGDVCRDRATAEATRAVGSLSALVKQQLDEARQELGHHADAGLGEVLAQDFKGELEALKVLSADLKARADDAMARFATRYPHVSLAVEGVVDGVVAPVATMGRWLKEARALLASPVSSAVAVSASRSGEAVGALKARRQSKAAAVAADVAAPKNPRLGQRILAVAHRVQASVTSTLAPAAEQVRAVARQGADLARTAARESAFFALSTVGHITVRGLVAGERWTRNNVAELTSLGEAIGAIRDKVGKASLEAMQDLGRSASVGATELRRLTDSTLRALDQALLFVGQRGF